MPAFADTAVDRAITSGMASPRACGQAITMTVTVRTTDWSTSPRAHQVTNVTSAAAVAMLNSIAANRSASTGEQRLVGGNTGGAVRVGDTVRRHAGPWTPSVHALLRHLEGTGFDRAPRAPGFDERGREVLSFLPATRWELPDRGRAGRTATTRYASRRIHSVHRPAPTTATLPGHLRLDGPADRFIDTVRHRVRASAEGIRRTAAAGDPAYQRMTEQGVDKALDTAVDELTDFPDT
jgi:hypothetical protein